MKELKKLYDRIVQQVNINLRELDFDVRPFVENLIDPEKMTKFYAFYGITPDHPLDLEFSHSGLAGSYFLGKCKVTNSLLYKSDIRGDELKREGSTFTFQNFSIPLTTDEVIDIRDSALIKTLVHNYSHDPETAERFFIRSTLAMQFANIHGSPMDGCFLGPFATVDLTTAHDSVIGRYSYIQAGEVHHLRIKPGTIWVNSPNNFNFYYRYKPEALQPYVHMEDGQPSGLLFDFIEEHQGAFQRVFNMVNLDVIDTIPASASLDRYAVILPKTTIAENVLVSQRAYLQNSALGKGANAQENCYIINSTLAGFDVTAHGAKLIEADLEENVFVGFNSFVRGTAESRVCIGQRCIIMPHTIIDIDEPLEIPPGHLVWGLIKNARDLQENSVSLTELTKIEKSFTRGRMHFEGNGAQFVKAFQDRIQHILEVNGAFYDEEHNNAGHAQKNQNLSLNTIQPFRFGEMEGLYPNMIIKL
ncbi:transferase [Desulfopila aestuarii]|uniref:Carbonic anhydrase or acetyltransferase, isoleucine patch superfamily n=1 Tax=Desulfopila aestuarii DSM 18488 TaxID=1121416 RepID=A0A1M7Y8U9_9BACT|nr:transferase [Desulfopila aestuarii]SHO49063.1 Carbonic anhydrase or acetyltransferase, isoleucine patch superfamily [Desulfopila aestuarii DSM 18488]